MNELCKLDLRALVAGVHDKRWTAAEVASAHVERIERLETRVQAWQHFEPEHALSRAKAVDRSGASGPLQGAPIAIKDIIDVSGMPTRYGSGIYALAPPARESAECVAALERAGAVVFGKSVTTEFAYYTPGKTRNPWNLAHTPGGSSMGSAASVACGMAAGALGTQTNGSVIRPAAFCGVVGYKPTLGAISNQGTLDPWPTLDHTGVFARSVADAALLASIIAREGLLAGTVASLERAPRLALVRSKVWDLAQPPQKALLEANAAALARAGAEVEALPLPGAFDDAHRVHRVIMAYEAARHFAVLQRRHRADMSTRFNELLDEGAAIDEVQYREALEVTRDLRAGFERLLEGYDAVLTPPAPGEAPPTLTETGSPAFCTLWTLLGAPSLTLPVGIGPAGLPLGLQVVGPGGKDERTLAVAAWCESRLSGGRLKIAE